MERALGLGSRRAAAMQGSSAAASSVLGSVSGVSSNLSRQARFKTKFGRTNRAKKGNNFQNLQNPRWFYDLRMRVRSDEWKRRGVRNHFPETWARNVDFVDSLESYVVDPEYHWEYYQQAHRQHLYNHPEDYTHLIDEVLEHVEKRPELWVPRCLRVMEDLKGRYGISQRQHTSYIKIFGRARFLKKAEEAFAKIGEEKLPYNKENYLTMCRAYILSRDRITEKVAVQKCRELYTEALKKGIIQPEYITLISFEKFYDALKRLGSELDNRTRSAEWAEKGHPLSRKNYDNETLWHNIKYARRATHTARCTHTHTGLTLASPGSGFSSGIPSTETPTPPPNGSMHLCAPHHPPPHCPTPTLCPTQGCQEGRCVLPPELEDLRIPLASMCKLPPPPHLPFVQSSCLFLTDPVHREVGAVQEGRQVDAVGRQHIPRTELPAVLPGGRGDFGVKQHKEGNPEARYETALRRFVAKPVDPPPLKRRGYLRILHVHRCSSFPPLTPPQNQHRAMRQ